MALRACGLSHYPHYPNAPALTLSEVKAAAAEAGIDTRFVDLAASTGSAQDQMYAGLPIGRARSVTVDHALTDATWQQMVGVFGRTFGGPGEVSVQGAQRRWSRAGITMTADALGHQTVVHAEARRNIDLPFAGLIVAFAAALMVSMVALASLEWTVGVAAVLLMALVVGGYMRAKTGGHRQLDETDQQMQTALNQCAALMLEPSAAVRLEAEPLDVESVRLDPELLSEDEAPSTSSHESRRRQRS